MQVEDYSNAKNALFFTRTIRHALAPPETICLG